jgi:hypothetical protein
MSAQAADHVEAPGTRADPAGDIGDLYAWHTTNDTMVMIMTIQAGVAPGTPAPYDADMLYGFHIDSNADGIADLDVYARFGQAPNGDWGVRFTGLPGGRIEGRVERLLTNGSAQVGVGPREDPFFFDETGFLDTLATGTLAFDPTRDDFAGLNATAIIVELPLPPASSGINSVQVWATSARK